MSRFKTRQALKDNIAKELVKTDVSLKANRRLTFITAPTEEAPRQESFLPVLHGKATDSIATMAGAPITENKLNNTGTVESREVKLVIDKFNELTGALGVRTHKLLSIALAIFTTLNHTGTKARQANFTTVNIPLKEYALYCGYDVLEHETATEEEATREAKRAENALKNARKKINKDLAILFSSSLTWSEKVRGKLEDYIDIRLIEAKGIRNGFIQIRFTQSFSEYLIKLPLTQYPVALLAVDERNNNAYAMGLKFTEHYSMDNNQIRGTAQLLKVKTLLRHTSLPDINNSTVKKVGWKQRIKEPFENSLDALTACGLLKNWEYSHSKGVTMTDEEATSWKSYEEWENTLVHFTLKDAPDHKARLEARAEEKKKTVSKRKKTTKKTAKTE